LENFLRNGSDIEGTNERNGAISFAWIFIS